MRKIAVLMGGTTREREVSLQSGKNVTDALSSLGKYEVIPVDLKQDDLSELPAGIDAAYIALHGGWGESGGVQAALNALKIPYTGPGVLASQIAMDKVKTKMVLEMKNVPTAKWSLASPGDEKPPFPLPVVVKPADDGSSVGITKVSAYDQWQDALKTANTHDGVKIMVEEFIPGREFAVSVIDGEAWPVVEIVAKNGFYGYDEKYNSEETRYPFLEDAALSEKLQKLAKEAYAAVGCRGITRVDFRVTPLGRCYVLELNTSPGFTSHSLAPKAGMKAGMTFAEVCDRILQSAAIDQ